LLRELAGIVGEAAVLPGAGAAEAAGAPASAPGHGPDDTAPYVTGARYGAGRALCVVRPSTASQVARIVALCASEGVTLVPQGANTGLVGASTPDASGNQVVLSLNRLDRHCTIDPVNRTVEVDAGMSLHTLNERLEPHGLWFPVDLGADPSIGGMVSSNTGGARLLRYGDVRHNLLGLEAVLFDPPGEMVRLGAPLRKNNTGIDLSQLFVGTSGLAGIVTRATLEAAVKPRQFATALVVPANDDEVARLLVDAEQRLGDFLAAFEAISGQAMRVALEHVPRLRNPFSGAEPAEFAILLELASSLAPERLDLQALLLDHLETALGEARITDAVIGHGEELWAMRHAISEAARQAGRIIGFDISVRRGDLMRLRREALRLVRTDFPQLRVVDFGHVGDGGLHFNLVWPHDARPAWSEQGVAEVRDAVYALTVEGFGGSFSAEHGVGPYNLTVYRRYTPSATLRLAGRLQRTLDPRRIGGCVDFGEVAAGEGAA
jgi:FAD/FMN-containing dehydrogenase